MLQRGRTFNLLSCFLLSRASERLFCSSHQLVNLVVYLSAKFGALNQRINEIRSCENLWWPLPQVLTLKFALTLILWLFNLAEMFPRVSRTIRDNSLHASSLLYASCPQEIKQPQPHAGNGKFH